MGLTFGEKIKTLITIVDENGIDRQQVRSIIKSKPCQGFWYEDNDGELKCVEDSSITNALNDANWWKLIFLDGSICKLSDAGKSSKKGGVFKNEYFEDAISDIISDKSSNWIGDDKSFDLIGFQNRINNFPKDTIPTTYSLWTLFSETDNEIFNKDRINKHRFSQLISMLSKSCNVLNQFRVPFYLLSDDTRSELIMEEKKL
jgi:hypothetical protein